MHPLGTETWASTGTGRQAHTAHPRAGLGDILGGMAQARRHWLPEGSMDLNSCAGSCDLPCVAKGTAPTPISGQMVGQGSRHLPGQTCHPPSPTSDPPPKPPSDPPLPKPL